MAAMDFEIMTNNDLIAYVKALSFGDPLSTVLVDRLETALEECEELARDNTAMRMREVRDGIDA